MTSSLSLTASRYTLHSVMTAVPHLLHYQLIVRSNRAGLPKDILNNHMYQKKEGGGKYVNTGLLHLLQHQ